MIPAERAHLHAAALSHPGMSGKNNEDRYAVSKKVFLQAGAPKARGVSTPRHKRSSIIFLLRLLRRSTPGKERKRVISSARTVLWKPGVTLFPATEILCSMKLSLILQEFPLKG